MKERKTPLRMCMGCREMKPKKELIRLVRGPDGAVSLDTTGKLPGRGAYICRSVACLKRAIKQKQPEHHLGAALSPETAAALQEVLASLQPEGDEAHG